MPYFLHPHNTPPETGTPYPDKQSAIAVRTNGLTISYLSNDSDRETWTQRERRRLVDHVYTALPWLDDDGIPQKRYRPVANDTRGYGDPSPFADHDWTQLEHYVTVSRYHYAHVSLKSDAMIAYTPSDEHGHADRQIRIRCGRYLDLVAPWLLPIEKDKLCARVRSMASAMFKLATTPSEIRAVYRYGQGFSSCMDGRTFSQDDDTNPVSAYGNSDLAVAYLGDIDSDDARVTARVVVWPEKKLFTRVYGDELLACLLKQDAWQSTDWEDGYPLTGAKIRAIPVRGSTRRYVMPYLDFANTVSLSSDKQHFIVCGPDDPGEFGCRETNGRSGSREIDCDHCGATFTQSENGESECSDCREGVWTCDNCSDSFYADDKYTEVRRYRGYDVNFYCERCANRIAYTCERCDEHFYDCQFSPTEHTTRRNDDLTDYCRSCADDVIEERTKEENDTDTPSVVVPIYATDDTETLPIPFNPRDTRNDPPFSEIAIGSTLRVITDPAHHTGTKTDDHTIQFDNGFTCDSIPAHIVYEVTGL